jgi:soluble lytic murein transglycosylase
MVNKMKGVVLGMIFLVLAMPLVLSFTDSNFAYRSGGFDSQAYLGGSVGLYGAQIREEQCSSGQDFVVQIAPFGCTPTVVRSDLLEEQNVAVFCPLIASQINPLIEVDRIDSVSFSGRDYSKEVAGIGFHPTRAALGFSRSSPIGKPIANDIGYVVIVLKQEPKEADMPEFVTGNLVANLRYKMSDIGVGSSTHYVPRLDDSEWEERFNQYGFWNGKGYIRVENVGENSARVSVYSGGDSTDRVRTFTLTKGQMSSEVYVPGFFCQAGAQLRLDGLVISDTRARFSVNGEIVEVRAGERFLENRCVVKKIDSQGLLQNVVVGCKDDDGEVNFELSRSPSVKIKVGEEERNVGIGERIFTKDTGEGVYLGGVRYLANPGEQKDLEISVFLNPSSADKLPEINDNMKASFKEVKYGDMKKLFDKEITLLGFSDGGNDDFSGFSSSGDFERYFSGAMDDYNSVYGNFGEEKIVDSLENVENTYGHDALSDAIGLAVYSDQNEEAIKLCNKFSEMYPNTIIEACSNVEDFSNTGISLYGVNVNGRFKEISFLEVVVPSFEEYGVKLSVDSDSIELSKGEKRSLGAGEYVQLVSLTETSVKLKVGLFDDKKKFSEKVFDLGKDKIESYKSNHSFGITRINIEKVAKLSVVPREKLGGTSSNFSFQIGIEKRAIQLSPEKTSERIDKLNKTIAKWTELSENLEKVVKGFKGACIATGAVLTVKNLFTGMGGEAIARGDVNEYWKLECRDKEYNGKEYNSIDHCLLENSDAIERDVDARASEIKIINQKGINDENRAERFREIVDRLKGQEFRNPDGTKDENGDYNMITIDDEFGEALLNTDDAGYLMNDREMRNIEMELSILEKDPDNVIARQKFDKYMGDFYVNNKLDVATRTYADKQGVDPKFVVNSNTGATEIIPVTEFLESGKVGSIPGGIITEGYVRFYKNAAGDEYVVGHDAEGVVKETYKKNGETWEAIEKDEKVDPNPLGLKFNKVDASSYKNKYKNPELTYFETEPYKGFPALVPIDSRSGWYAAMKQKTGAVGGIASYEESGAVSSFSLCNVGVNGREEFNSGLGDDECRVFNPGTGSIYGTFPGLTKSKTDSLVRCAMNGVEQAESKYGKGVSSVSIQSCSGGSESFKVGNPAVNLPNVMCQDFMSPKDCLILFNVCDPVICPSSRCDFGGTYPVDNVVQSGIIGSIALCLPNYKEKILVPVCLTGIQAGIDGLVSIFQNYQDCLQHNLETGEMTGICDEIHSIYLCEFFWRQGIPLMNMGIPKVLSALTGEGKRGGGEYSNVQAAWDNANAGVGYMTNYYGANALAAFKAQSTEEVGSTVCKSFASVNYPNSGGGFLDALLEPESPSQYHAWFSEIPFTSATVPPTSQYKAFYHIFSGKDQGAYFNVYLSNPTGGSYYQSTGRLLVASGYIKRGEYASETVDLTGPEGYNELCISVNGKENCGFKRVSTSFALNYMNDKFIEEQTTKENINSEKECVGGSASAYSLLQPNIQEGADEVINPELYNRGIVRVCSTSSPGEGTDSNWNNPEEARWRKVGVCDSEKMGCWIDTESVEGVVKSTAIEDAIIGDVTDKYMEMLGSEDYLDMDEGVFDALIEELHNMENKKDVLVKVDSNLLSKVLMNNNKAKLLMIRAAAYDKLAREARGKISKEQAGLSDDEAGDPEEGKSCEDMGGVFKEIECDSDDEDITDSVVDKRGLAEGYFCCRERGPVDPVSGGGPQNGGDAGLTCEDCGKGPGFCDKAECLAISGCEFTPGDWWGDRWGTCIKEDGGSSGTGGGSIGDIKPYEEWIVKYAKENNIEPSFVAAVMRTESNFDSSAVSPTGCTGLMQFCSGAARSHGLCDPSGCSIRDDRINPEKNIEAGSRYLSELVYGFNEYNDKYKFALASYNGGAGVVRSAAEDAGGLDSGWNSVSEKITIDVLKEFDIYNNLEYFPDDAALEAKVNEIKNYVDKVIAFKVNYEYLDVENYGLGRVTDSSEPSGAEESGAGEPVVEGENGDEGEVVEDENPEEGGVVENENPEEETPAEAEELEENYVTLDESGDLVMFNYDAGIMDLEGTYFIFKDDIWQWYEFPFVWDFVPFSGWPDESDEWISVDSSEIPGSYARVVVNDLKGKSLSEGLDVFERSLDDNSGHRLTIVGSNGGISELSNMGEGDFVGTINGISGLEDVYEEDLPGF